MIELRIPDMTCSHCASTVTRAVKALDSAARVEVALDEHRVRIESSATGEAILRAIAEAGYRPETV